jgi:hypothetical protein
MLEHVRSMTREGGAYPQKTYDAALKLRDTLVKNKAELDKLRANRTDVDGTHPEVDIQGEPEPPEGVQMPLASDASDDDAETAPTSAKG